MQAEKCRRDARAFFAGSGAGAPDCTRLTVDKDRFLV
jgi:hypothetical protein